MSDLASRVRKVVEREMAVIKQQLSRNGVVTTPGTARFTGPHSVEVEGDLETQLLTADYFLIACGTRPAC